MDGTTLKLKKVEYQRLLNAEITEVSCLKCTGYHMQKENCDVNARHATLAQEIQLFYPPVILHVHSKSRPIVCL
jgi:Zn ribbon nucleic-acid-binding protein